ncbi:Proton/glutamate symporter @ Sodium/glutamate symporter [hydrothermal vent metagenome]|uniref:Proton/glutamate symporter @ Sodium/glutamate symporter n=1 Tax=hydrothermal vent metagenome TaxID=652676 RepID=A0A3B0RG06_9ZZZZ
MAWWFKLVLWQRVLAALVLGVLLGLAFRSFGGTYEVDGITKYAGADFVTVWIKPFGSAFVQLIKMLVVPLVFTTLVTGITSMGHPSKLGTIGLRAFVLYVFTTLVAVSIGLFYGTIFKPGSGVDFTDVVPNVLEGTAPTMTERLINIIPANPVQALASGDMLAIIFFALMLGVAILMVGKRAEPIKVFFDASVQIMFKITHWVMELAPYGVFALITWVTATKGVETFSSVLMLALALYLGCITHMIIMYGGLVKIGLRLPLVRFFRGILDAQVVAYSTSTSAGTLPVTITCVQDNLGIKPVVAGSVLPLGATINMDGTSLYLGLLALFAANAFGIDLSLGDYGLIALTATLASIGTASIPSASLFMLAIVLPTIGVSPEQIALMVGFILPFDRPLDMMRTLTNVTGDAAVATAVAKWEGELDEDVYRAVANV